MRTMVSIRIVQLSLHFYVVCMRMQLFTFPNCLEILLASLRECLLNLIFATKSIILCCGLRKATIPAQIAKLCGAHVTATCGARNMELVRSLGADEVLDYKTPDGAKLKSPSGRTYDAVINCTSGIPWSTFSPNLKPISKVVELTPSVKSLATTAIKKLTSCQQELIPYWVSGKSEDLELLAELARCGKLKTIIDSQYPFAKAEEAWARSIEGHSTGKVVVIVD